VCDVDNLTHWQVRSTSGFVDIDRTSNPNVYVDRLERTAGTLFWHTMKMRMLEMLDLRSDDQVLDVGCGIGSDIRAIAQLVGLGGRAVGIDRSSTILREAHRRIEGRERLIQYIQGDAQKLPFSDASFDVCRAERVLQHLADPFRALAEMARVTRAAGRIGLVEPDYGTETIQGASPELTRRILDCRRAHFRQPTIGRALPAMFKALDWRGLSVSIMQMATSELSDSERQVLGKYAERATGAGAISADTGARWLAELETRAARGQYRHGVAVFLVGGWR
jgi:ubiquinone/menaquinone biosynthesis C-methylase UbiE